jgi:hypothetical protein
LSPPSGSARVMPGTLPPPAPSGVPRYG